MEKKSILVLEDTGHIVTSYVNAIQKAGFQQNVHYACTMDYNLSDFDAVFVDRDNSLAGEGMSQEFHTYFLKLFKETIKKSRPFEPWRIFPASADSLNNQYLVNALESIMEKERLINSREERNEFRVELLMNFVDKSKLRDGSESFEKEISKHLTRLTQRIGKECGK